MSRTGSFDNPLLLGFEHFEQVLDRLSKSSGEGYPPYNIEQTKENGLRISLAVAGFEESELEITIENNQLVIRGRKHPEGKDRIYLYRGIASRQFQKSFILAEGIEVMAASTENGLLHIDLERPEPAVCVRHIEINKKDGNE